MPGRKVYGFPVEVKPAQDNKRKIYIQISSPHLSPLNLFHLEELLNYRPVGDSVGPQHVTFVTFTGEDFG